MSIAPGSRLGPFEVTSILGAGAMGQVYRARDARLNRDVAIKVLPPEFATDPARMARFAREAQVLAALSHTNIAAIFGLEESGGATALVMELVEGQTLEDRIAAGAVPRDEALDIARQIGDALEAAHEKGIIHRDLKPANVKITPEGKVKVLDFGLAKAMDADPISGSGSQPNAPTMTLDSTRAGQIMGTPAYMSPEQARGKPVDRRGDIWAFGVVLYEMLTGKQLFTGETLSDILADVLRADIDLKQLPADTPPKLRRLLQRCLERDPRRRLRDIGDAWIEMDTPDAPVQTIVAAPPAKRNWLPWAAAIVIGGAGLAWGFLRPLPVVSRPVTRWLVTQKSFAGFLNISHDGARLAYTDGTSNNNLQIGVRVLDQFEGRQLSAELAFVSVFSPDGQWIVYGTPQNKIKKVPATGGSPISICDGTSAFGLAWGGDDTILFSSGKSIFRVPAGGGTAEKLTTADTAKGEISHVHPQFLPNGQVLFTISTNSTLDTGNAAVLDLASKSYKVVAPSGRATKYAPTGHLLYVRTGTLYALPFDLKSMTAMGTEAPVIESVSTVGPQGYADYSFSDDGILVYLTGNSRGGQGTTLSWVDRQGTATAITSTPQMWGTGRLSPDGARIANGLDRAGGERDIWIYEIARGVTTRLTFEGSSDNPIWTVDGRNLIHESTRNGKSGLYSVPADGSGKAELLLAIEAGRATPSSVTPDGKTIVYTLVGANARPHLMVYTTGSQPKPLHDPGPYSEVNGQLSPDGKWLAYESSESGAQEVYVQPFPGPGAKVRVSEQGASWPRWSRNMKELLFWEGGGPVTGLMSVDIQTGAAFVAAKPRRLFSRTAGTTWDVTPDGKRFLVEQTATSTAASGSTLAVVTDWFDELRRRAPVKK